MGLDDHLPADVLTQLLQRLAALLGQLEHAQAVRKDDVLAVPRLAPVLQVGDVLDERRVVEVAVLREVCGHTSGS